MARLAVRLALVSDRWESRLSQMAGAKAKQAVRQHTHLSKFFFLMQLHFKDRGAKLRIFCDRNIKKSALRSGFNKSFDNVLSFTTPKTPKNRPSQASSMCVTTKAHGPSSTTAPKI